MSAFLLRCSLRYHRSLLFFGINKDTARAKSCHPWTNTNGGGFVLQSKMDDAWLAEVWLWLDDDFSTAADESLPSDPDAATDCAWRRVGGGEAEVLASMALWNGGFCCSCWWWLMMPVPLPTGELDAALEESHVKRLWVAHNSNCCKPARNVYVLVQFRSILFHMYWLIWECLNVKFWNRK